MVVTNCKSVSNDSLDYATSIQNNKFLIRIMGPMFRFWNWNMDFHKFAIAGELLVITACNRYQTKPWARHEDYKC